MLEVWRKLSQPKKLDSSTKIINPLEMLYSFMMLQKRMKAGYSTRLEISSILLLETIRKYLLLYRLCHEFQTRLIHLQSTHLILILLKLFSFLKSPHLHLLYFSTRDLQLLKRLQMITLSRRFRLSIELTKKSLLQLQMSNQFNYLLNLRNQLKEILVILKSNQATLIEQMWSQSLLAGHMKITLKLSKILIL